MSQNTDEFICRSCLKPKKESCRQPGTSFCTVCQGNINTRKAEIKAQAMKRELLYTPLT